LKDVYNHLFSSFASEESIGLKNPTRFKAETHVQSRRPPKKDATKEDGASAYPIENYLCFVSHYPYPMKDQGIELKSGYRQVSALEC